MKTTLKNTLGYDLYQVVRKHTLTRLSHRSQAVLCAQFIKQIEDKLIEYEKSALPDLYGDENTPWIVADIEARMNGFLMLDGHDYGGQVLAGDSLDQLDEVLAYWSSIPEVCR